MCFLLGLFAIAGLPPFSVFSSELNLIISAFAAGQYGPAALFICLVAAVFAGLVLVAMKMFFGNDLSPQIEPGEQNWLGLPVLIILLLVVAVTGVFMPERFKQLLEAASGIIRGVA